jgi:hypothetical protein
MVVWTRGVVARAQGARSVTWVNDAGADSRFQFEDAEDYALVRGTCGVCGTGGGGVCCVGVMTSRRTQVIDSSFRAQLLLVRQWHRCLPHPARTQFVRRSQLFCRALLVPSDGQRLLHAR